MVFRGVKSRIPLARKTWVPPAYPKVPHGVPSFASIPFRTFKLRNKILAGGKNIQFGNTVSEFKNHTRRIWRPNIKTKSIWSATLGRRIKLRMVTSVMRTMEKVGGLDAYLTCHGRSRMKELGPRGWEIRSKVIQQIRRNERHKHVRMFQRSILLCPKLRMDSEWKEIRPLIKHTEGYAVLPEQFCKTAFQQLMERLREGRPRMQRLRYKPRTIALTNKRASQLARKARLASIPEEMQDVSHPKTNPVRKIVKPVETEIAPPVAINPAKLAARKKEARLAAHKARQRKESEEKKKRVMRAREAGIRNAIRRKTMLS